MFFPQPVSICKVTQEATQLETSFSDRVILRLSASGGGQVIGGTVQGQEFDHPKRWCEFINMSCVLS